MVSAEEVEEWAEANDFTDEDIEQFAEIFNIGQGLLQIFSEDELPHEVREDIDGIHDALKEAAEHDGEEYELENYEDYTRRLKVAQPVDWAVDGDD